MAIKKSNTPTTPTTPIEANSVLKLLSNKKRWIKCASARKSNRVLVSTDHPEACQFCLSGAVHRVYRDSTKAEKIMAKLSKVIIKYSLGKHKEVVSFNDSRTTKFADIQRIVSIAGV